MEQILLLVLVGAIAVSCLPVEPQENNEKFQKYFDQITALTKRIEGIKAELWKQKDEKTPASLEDSLEAAVAADKKAEAATKDAPVKSTNVVSKKGTPVHVEKADFFTREDPLEYGDDMVYEYGTAKAKKSVAKEGTTPNKRGMSEIVVPYLSKGMLDVIKEDIEDTAKKPAAKKDAVKKPAAKKAAKKPAAKKPKPVAKKDAEDKKDTTSEIPELPFLDEDMQDIVDEVKKEDLKNVRREEMTYFKQEVNHIKDHIHKIKNEFADVKKIYLATVKDHPLNKKTKEKFEIVKMDIEAVKSGIHDLFNQFTDSNKVQDELSSEIPNAKTYLMLSDMTEQLQGASGAIQQLKDLVIVKDHEVATGVGEALHVEDEEDVKEEGYEAEMKELMSLRDEVKNVIHKMKDIKKDIDKRKLNSA